MGNRLLGWALGIGNRLSECALGIGNRLFVPGPGIGNKLAAAGETAHTKIAVPKRRVLYEVMTAERPFRDDTLVLLAYRISGSTVTLKIEGPEEQGVGRSLCQAAFDGE